MENLENIKKIATVSKFSTSFSNCIQRHRRRLIDSRRKFFSSTECQFDDKQLIFISSSRLNIIKSFKTRRKKWTNWDICQAWRGITLIAYKNYRQLINTSIEKNCGVRRKVAHKCFLIKDSSQFTQKATTRKRVASWGLYFTHLPSLLSHVREGVEKILKYHTNYGSF